MQNLQLLHVIPAALRWTHKAAALQSFHCIKQKLQAAVASWLRSRAASRHRSSAVAGQRSADLQGHLGWCFEGTADMARVRWVQADGQVPHHSLHIQHCRWLPVIRAHYMLPWLHDRGCSHHKFKVELPTQFSDIGAKGWCDM